MKRRLINYEVFERIEKDSLSTAEKELAEAAPILAQALNMEDIRLHCFGSDDVVYEAVDGSFIHANYRLREGFVEFDKVEQLVINEESEIAKSRDVLTNLVDALLQSDNKRADMMFDEWLSLPKTNRVIKEAKELRVVPIRKDGQIKGYKKARWQTTPKHPESASVTAKRMRSKVKNQKKMPDSKKKLASAKRSRIKQTIGEWAVIAENVFGFVDYRQYGPALQESKTQQDERGNIIAIRVPSTKLRTEAKLLEFDWKTLNTDLVVKRGNAKKLTEDMDFIKALTTLKRQNGLSDNSGLEEALENIVSRWPHVLYLTQTELASGIKEALETAGEANFDDQTCDFMAEGILRMAHNAYVDRVAKVLKLAGHNVAENTKDAYEDFKGVAERFYPGLDQNIALEMQMFVDLYEALRQVYELATEEKNSVLQFETSQHLDELVPILRQEIEPSLDVAEAAAEYLYDLVETNLESETWSVSNTPHVTVTGDHPDMAKKAKQGYVPASDFSGDWGDPAPVSDGKSYRGNSDEMRNNSWGNISNDDTYPSMKNPYVPAPFGDYKIKGEKTIDADTGHLGHWGDTNTWPALQNPYVPKSVTPQDYKMKNGPDTDLVVDK